MGEVSDREQRGGEKVKQERKRRVWGERKKSRRPER